MPGLFMQDRPTKRRKTRSDRARHEHAIEAAPKPVRL